MKKVSKQTQRMEATHGKPTMTMGLDMGDLFSHYCFLNEEGDVVEEGRMQSIHARSSLVRARTMIVNALRGLVKSAGGSLRRPRSQAAVAA